MPKEFIKPIFKVNEHVCASSMMKNQPNEWPWQIEENAEGMVLAIMNDGKFEVRFGNVIHICSALFLKKVN